jgi:hypothetical protein
MKMPATVNTRPFRYAPILHETRKPSLNGFVAEFVKDGEGEGSDNSASQACQWKYFEDDPSPEDLQNLARAIEGRKCSSFFPSPWFT